MYRNQEDQVIYSPSDLIRFMESPFASWMERFDLECPGEIERDTPSEELKLVAKTGEAHEAEFLAKLKFEGRDVCEILQKGRERAAEETKAAVKSGREIIFQGYLVQRPFAGYTDFLVLGEGGQGFYEVWDTKLARKTKPYFLIQLCCYAEMLEELQGRRPEHVRVVLGTNEIKRFRTDDFFFYYQNLKEAFLALMNEFDAGREPPEPDPRADHGLWQSHAHRWLSEQDHLVQVAGITLGQIKKLNETGIRTVAQLAETDLSHVPKMGNDVFQRLRDQAAIQEETRRRQEKAGIDQMIPPAFRIRIPGEINPHSGLALLPPGSPGDVYFDIEGFPLENEGLEYLLGAITLEDGQPTFHDWWAHDSLEERQAFEEFVDWVFTRWQEDPRMHVYHYANYEVSAMRRLMGRYGTREDEVDDLLRNEVFVDLYQIVRQGMLLGDSSYSLKNVEKLYKEQRAGDVTTAAGSMVFYAWWIESGQSRDWRESEILRDIRDYNEEDCISTWQLTDWLRKHQQENSITCLGQACQEGDESSGADEPRPVNENVRRRRQMAARLLEKIPANTKEREQNGEFWRIQEMLAFLLEFHRREAKPIWWAMFARHAKTEQELIDDLDCLGGCQRTNAEPEVIRQSLGFWYEFDPDQDTKLSEGKKARFAHDLSVTVEIFRLNPEGRVQLKISRTRLKNSLGGAMPGRLSVIPQEYVNPAVIEQSIERLVEAWEENGCIPGCFRRFLLREPPEVEGNSGGKSLLYEGEGRLEGCIRIAKSMRHSTLCIQGPPGTGKTYTASHVIVELLREGKNVGVTSNSHKAILNLMTACHEALCGEDLQAIKAGGEGDPALERCPGIHHIEDPQSAIDQYSGGLIGGTAWMFSRPDMKGRLDYLFVDEAGQVSVANLAGMAHSAKNLVLIGDQMQLSQPVKGAHPGESGQSLLEYLLQDHSVVPSDIGVFLDCSWRMHPDVCRFISESVYAGRLTSHPRTANRVICPGPGKKPMISATSGIVFSPVEHHGNTQASEEEVQRILEITHELLTRTHTDEGGSVVGRLEIGDILFVAPYNMQVRRLQEQLPEGARVGSVDKFQGQEAPVVIVSMCSSAGDFGTRGIGFILNKNRLNVAVSRAQSLAIVVGDPNISSTHVGSVADMEQVNLFCRIIREC